MILPLTNDRDAIATLPSTRLGTPDQYRPTSDLGISKFSADLGGPATLDSLLVNKGSQTLLVSFHGALQRSTVVLPRFERLRTLLETPYSSLYIGDPTLHLNETLALGWYTGWRDLDLFPILASWIEQTAQTIGAKRIVVLGSSGGGYAALQVSSLIPDTLAVPMNPQTQISQYRPSGSLAFVRSYVCYVMPHLAPPGGVAKIGPEVDLSQALGDRASAILRYLKPRENYVLYVQNLNDDSHRIHHYQPFRDAVATGPNASRIRFLTHDGPHTHNAPTGTHFLEILTTAIDWICSSDIQASG